MKRRFAEEQIIDFLWEADEGVAAKKFCGNSPVASNGRSWLPIAEIHAGDHLAPRMQLVTEPRAKCDPPKRDREAAHGSDWNVLGSPPSRIQTKTPGLCRAIPNSIQERAKLHPRIIHLEVMRSEAHHDTQWDADAADFSIDSDQSPRLPPVYPACQAHARKRPTSTAAGRDQPEGFAYSDT